MAVHFENAQVRLLWARPNHDYDVAVREEGPDQVNVWFRSGGTRSVVRAYYEDGKPAVEVSERGGGKDDDGRIESNSTEPVRQGSGWQETDGRDDDRLPERG